MATVNIAGLSKAVVLAQLYNATQALGMGIIHDLGRDMSVKEAEGLIATCPPDSLYFDYVFGRPIKSDIGGDSFDPRLFDRDAGEGAASRAVDALRATTVAA